MRSSKADLPKTLEMEGSTIREAEWGETHIEYGSFAKEFDVTPFLKGLPNDRCQCPHWGYLMKGNIKLITKDGKETLKAGDIYYMPPGHTAVIGAGAEYVEFSPKDKYKLTMEAMMRNMEAIQK